MRYIRHELQSYFTYLRLDSGNQVSTNHLTDSRRETNNNNMLANLPRAMYVYTIDKY